MVEHLLHFYLLGVHEQCIRDLHRAVLFALPAVDTRVGYVGKPDHVEHETDREFPGWHEVRFLRAAFHAVTDRAVLDTGITFDAAGGVFNNLRQADFAIAKCRKVVFPPLVAELEHGTFDFRPDLDTFRVCRFGCDGACLDGGTQEFCTLLAADFDERGFSCLVTDDPPVTAGKVCLARDF